MEDCDLPIFPETCLVVRSLFISEEVLSSNVGSVFDIHCKENSILVSVFPRKVIIKERTVAIANNSTADKEQSGIYPPLIIIII